MNRKRKLASPVQPRSGPLPSDPHEIVFYKDSAGVLPAQEFIDSCPETIRARIRETAITVAASPPNRFSGGGKWEAMHGAMSGWFEIRIDGTPSRTHYRVYCLLDYEAAGAVKPYLVLVDGRKKPFRTTLAPSEYDKVKLLGGRYLSSKDRSIG
ncbi:hypothetical protein [Sanguibacter sp. 25GB23B1]|uniref:hypothetical protein n=1 Tax=unclassified Sanguibacter TaxID=2645534 RepID=UPI0032AED633